MAVNIDEIFDMLSWDNEVSMQLSGIQKAKQIKSLGVLILPILSNNSKSVWENCAKVLVSKNDDELMPYIINIFEWLQDLNWPGSGLIYDRLLNIPFDKLELPLKICLKKAKNNNDLVWEKTLKSFKEEALTRCKKR